MLNDSQSIPMSSRWRLSAEVLAYAVCRMIPEVEPMGGGVNSLGCFYDFIFPQNLTTELIEVIEIEWRRLIKEAIPIRYLTMMRENAQSLLNHHGFFIPAENAGNELSNIIELIQIEDFYALCPSLALETTVESGFAKILEFSILCSEQGATIVRIIGTTRPDAKELKAFLKKYHAYLKKTDHRILGPMMNLFTDSDLKNGLGVVWHPKGMQLKRLLLDWIDQRLPAALPISTPSVVPFSPACQAGDCLHPFEFEGEDYRLRSSLLKQHLQYVGKTSREMDDGPWKIKETAELWRHFPEADRWGLFCSCHHTRMQFTIRCQKNQVVQELISSLLLIEEMITIFDFEARWVLEAGSAKSKRAQEAAADLLKRAGETSQLKFDMGSQRELEKDVAAQLQLRVCDPIGREWPLSEIGILLGDAVFNALQTPLEERSGLEEWAFLTINPLVSLERFIALLIEHYSGKIPFWLMPEQVRVLSMGKANEGYAHEVERRLIESGVRVQVDGGPGKLGFKIHQAGLEHVPYVLIVGERERLRNQVSVREAGGSNRDQLVGLEEFLETINRRK